MRWFSPFSALLLSLGACDADGEGIHPGGGGGVGDSGETQPPDCDTVTLAYRASLTTVAGDPFDLTYQQDAGRTVAGTMTYDPCVPDTDALESPDHGEFDHAQWSRGGFTMTLEGEGTPLEVVGSTRPVVGIRNLDYFDFEDGGWDVVEEVERYLTVNGQEDQEADLFFTIGGGSVDLGSDELPEVFPMTGTSEDDFACVSQDSYCITFSLGESTFGDSFLMRVLELVQVE